MFDSSVQLAGRPVYMSRTQHLVQMEATPMFVAFILFYLSTSVFLIQILHNMKAKTTHNFFCCYAKNYVPAQTHIYINTVYILYIYIYIYIYMKSTI